MLGVMIDLDSHRASRTWMSSPNYQLEESLEEYKSNKIDLYMAYFSISKNRCHEESHQQMH